MIETLIIIGSIIFIIGLICLYKDKSGLDFLLGVMGAYILSSGIVMYLESLKPTAMDVYKEKTTLQITYRDSIPVDSVVVFKEKEK